MSKSENPSGNVYAVIFLMATIIVGTLQIIPLRLFSLLKVPEVSKTELLINALSREKAFKDLSQEKTLPIPTGMF